MIPILLFFGLCFFGFGDCEESITYTWISNGDVNPNINPTFTSSNNITWSNDTHKITDEDIGRFVRDLERNLDNSLDYCGGVGFDGASVKICEQNNKILNELEKINSSLEWKKMSIYETPLELCDGNFAEVKQFGGSSLFDYYYRCTNIEGVIFD